MKGAPVVFVALGSNIGDPEATLARSLPALERGGFRVTTQSSLYLTEPVDAPAQNWFVNAVVGGTTDLTPEELLGRCLEIEAQLGRVRSDRHGPRTIDLDLLLHGDLVRATQELTLPHPRLHERLFVLIPLEEIAPLARHPVLGKSITQLRAECRDDSRVVFHRRPLGVSR